MRNLKKILALVLALMMVVSTMVFASAASLEDYVDGDEVSAEYAEAVEVLTGMGIFKGDEEGFRPQDTITRAEVSTSVYRVLSGDVEDANVEVWKEYTMFDDVASDAWYAGFVNYAANVKWVIGVGNNKFDPSSDVTGYEMLAILLRALGYDKNQEFANSDDWRIEVAAIAEEIGLTDVLISANLNRAMTREQIAALMFQALNTSTVKYTLAYGYRPTGETLGEDLFNLTPKTDVPDAWGRPQYGWSYDVGDKGTYYDYAYTLYTEAELQCDVAAETGVSGTAVEAYDNGVKTTTAISKAGTTATIGAQGQQTYVYPNVEGAARVVFIDTYLAMVVDVNEAKVDADGHVAVPASTELTVYDVPAGVTDDDIAGADYAVGTMLLVNVNEAKDEIVVVDVATSFVGAQTKIHYNADYHTVNGKDYPDAQHFDRDDAGITEDYNFNWSLDQYGNLIGVTAITGNYAVIADLIWIDGTPGHAEATLLYMDGTVVEDVVVDSIDGFDYPTFTWDRTEDDAAPIKSDSAINGFNNNVANVSTDSILNGVYNGYAMYRVDTNADGSVNLEGREGYPPVATMLNIEYADNAILDIDTSAIRAADGTVLMHVSTTTQFLVRNGNSYDAYTGTASLPDFNWWTVEVFYDDVNNDTVADYVYVRSYSNVHGAYVFATDDAASIRTDDYGVYVEGVYVDGVETTVIADPWVADELIRNPGKLYYANWEISHDTARYGVLEDITLVNEDTDYDGVLFDDTFANYIEDMSGLRYVNGTLVIDGNLSYNVGSSVEVIYTDEAYEMSLADVVKAIREGTAEYGIWVLGNRLNNTFFVYAGTRLDEENDITVTGETGLSVTGPTTANPDTWTVKINDKRDDGKLDLTVDMVSDSEYAYYYVQREPRADESAPVAVSDPQETDAITLSDVQKGDVYKVWVYTECAWDDATSLCSPEMWTIEVDGWNIISDSVTKVTYEEWEVLYGQPLDAYYSYETAIDNLTVIDADTFAGMRVYADNGAVIIDDATNYPVKALAFSTTGLAQQSDETDFASATNTTQVTPYAYYGFDGLQSGGVVVFGFTPQNEGTETVYVAFQIVRD